MQARVNRIISQRDRTNTSKAEQTVGYKDSVHNLRLLIQEV